MTANNSHAQVVAADSHEPKVHASSHESGGSDEIDVTGLTGAGGGSAPDCYENFVTSPVTLVNADTWYAGPALTLGAGDWLIIAHLTLTSSFNGQTSVEAKISDGTTDYAFGQDYIAAQNYVNSITLMARVTLGGSTTIRAYGASARGSSVASILDNPTSPASITSDKASSLVALAITSA